jgi:hypothetical protein
MIKVDVLEMSHYKHIKSPRRDSNTWALLLYLDFSPRITASKWGV